MPPTNLSQYPQVVWTGCVLGDNGELVSGRTYRDVPPSSVELAEQLIKYNHPRRDECRKDTMVVVQSSFIMLRQHRPTAVEMAEAKRRLDQKHWGQPKPEPEIDDDVNELARSR
jgi:hypothetical protein